MIKQILCVALVGFLFLFSAESVAKPDPLAVKPFEALSPESQQCAACHAKENVGLYQQWGRSKHYGANVGCYECHAADPKDKDAISHQGFDIAIIVSPKDCAQCHEKEVDQFAKSHHADAGKILGSLDNFLAEVVEGKLSFNGQSSPADRKSVV